MTTKKDPSQKKQARGDRSQNPPPPPPPSSPDASLGEENPAKEKGGIKARNTDESSKPKPKRMSFNLTEENAIDWESMKDGNRSELQAVLMADPELRKSLTGADEDQIEFSADDVREILEKLSSFNASATGFFFRHLRKWPIHRQILDKAFTLPKNEKVDKTAERGALVANRHAPAFLKRYMNEIMFVTGYLDIVKAQVNYAIAMQNNFNEKMGEGKTQAEPPASAGQESAGSQVPQ